MQFPFTCAAPDLHATNQIANGWCDDMRDNVLTAKLKDGEGTHLHVRPCLIHNTVRNAIKTLSFQCPDFVSFRYYRFLNSKGAWLPHQPPVSTKVLTDKAERDWRGGGCLVMQDRRFCLVMWCEANSSRALPIG